jgi:hypothetical protein
MYVGTYYVDETAKNYHTIPIYEMNTVVVGRARRGCGTTRSIVRVRTSRDYVTLSIASLMIRRRTVLVLEVVVYFTVYTAVVRT